MGYGKSKDLAKRTQSDKHLRDKAFKIASDPKYDIYIFSKFAWVVPLKFKREITTVNAFQKIISEGRKPNKIWVDQGGEF